jgi:N6-adenosine-specific RNA methylase IME4
MTSAPALLRPSADEGSNSSAAESLLAFANGRRWSTIYADPPWRFTNKTGKVGPEHRRLFRYGTMTNEEIMNLPVAKIVTNPAHLYLWVPTALMPAGLATLEHWGFRYVSVVYWHKLRKDGGSDGRGVGFYFRNVIEPCLFGVRGSLRTLPPGRSQVNYLGTRKREHSRKPDEFYSTFIERCSPGPYLELFARGPTRDGWDAWGNQAGLPTSLASHRASRGGAGDQLHSGAQAQPFVP